jgi:putative component of membrane protein insertase Oxa1/YidC/SpoIIIJ protein YidD
MSKVLLATLSASIFILGSSVSASAQQYCRHRPACNFSYVAWAYSVPGVSAGFMRDRCSRIDHGRPVEKPGQIWGSSTIYCYKDGVVGYGGQMPFGAQ